MVTQKNGGTNDTEYFSFEKNGPKLPHYHIAIQVQHLVVK